MGKLELVNAMLDDQSRRLNDRGWSGFAHNLNILSEEGYQKMLSWGPDNFQTIVSHADFETSLTIKRYWNLLSEANVDEFLRLQRLHAPATPLSDSTVAAILAAWFNGGMGVTTPHT